MKWHNEDVTIKKTGRKKTMNIVIERDGNLCVLVPENLEEEDILNILNKKEYEITKKIILWNESHRNKVVRRYIDGQSFMYLGKNYCLQFVKNQNSNILLKNGRFLMNSNVKNPRQTFINYYKTQAEIKIKERFDYYKSFLNLPLAKMDIRDIQNRWGSCTPRGEIFYHWKCIMAPIKVLDYIIVHELVHLIYPNHSREFWDKVGSILPDYENSKDWLLKNGIRLDV